MRLPSNGRPGKLSSFRSRPLSFLRLAVKRRQFPIFPLRKPLRVYGRIGNLEVRLARSVADIRRAQRLRFDVFYKEMAAVPDGRTLQKKRDEDEFDPICDHLLVTDISTEKLGRRPWPRRAKVVGTYRVLLQEIAEKNQGFYTQGEYDIAPLIARKRATHRFMGAWPLLRAQALSQPPHRRTPLAGPLDLCARARRQCHDRMRELPGTDPKEHALALSFLHHYARAPEEWRVSAHPELKVDMNLMPKEEVNAKEALKHMPPLIKGYLHLGAYIGDGAVVDKQFGTTDVLIIMPVEAIDLRYFSPASARRTRSCRSPHRGADNPSTSRAQPGGWVRTKGVDENIFFSSGGRDAVARRQLRSLARLRAFPPA